MSLIRMTDETPLWGRFKNYPLRVMVFIAKKNVFKLFIVICCDTIGAVYRKHAQDRRSWNFLNAMGGMG
jgi:hypothetical protein